MARALKSCTVPVETVRMAVGIRVVVIPALAFQLPAAQLDAPVNVNDPSNTPPVWLSAGVTRFPGPEIVPEEKDRFGHVTVPDEMTAVPPPTAKLPDAPVTIEPSAKLNVPPLNCRLAPGEMATL